VAVDTDRWNAICREATAAVAAAVESLPTRAEREPVHAAGAGGDDTTAVDAAAEAAVVSVLERAAGNAPGFALVSEELGERDFGEPDGTVVVVDPIDGSLNAKRGVPHFSLSIAVAEGRTMDDVVLGFVHDFGTGEEWTAVRGAGARLGGAPLEGPGPKDEVEVLALEATTTELLSAGAAAAVGFAYRARVLGSLALSLCHLAAGRVDAVCSLKPARSVDIAAAQLLVRERGFAIDTPDAPPFGGHPLDLEGRSRVVAGATPERCAELWARLAAIGR
jgi:myo-inositol-1(or 4)-monophosphatase